MKQRTEPLEAYYHDICLLHEGAHLVTYAAVESATDTAVVIKMLDFKKIQAWKALELFEREVTVLQGLSHPAIPEYRDAFQANYCAQSFYCLVQKRVPGQTLQQWIDRGYRFTEAEIVELGKQLLEVLRYLHGFLPPIIHRDIKPENLIWHDSQLSVLDFGGVLKHLGPAQSTVVGTYGYMAPEQFQGKARLESDLYSVGMTLAHALSHVHPSQMQSSGLSIDISSHLQCSAPLLQWLKKLTALVPESRFQNAEQALSALMYTTGDSIQALKAENARDVYVSSPMPDLSVSARDLTGIVIEETPEKLDLQIQLKNGVSTQMALKIDAFVVLPGLLMAGILKWVGYSWLLAALLPSSLVIPVVIFFLLTLHYAQLHVTMTPTGVVSQKRLGAFRFQKQIFEPGAVQFSAKALGATIRQPDAQSPASLRLLDHDTAEERVLHLGLPLKTYTYIADRLNARASQAEPGL